MRPVSWFSPAGEVDQTMDKSPEAFRTISEVADALDVPPHVLRFWETRFNQVKPVKRGGGRRYYRPEDVRLLRGIRGLLYDDGMTIKGVQKILRERGIRHVISLGTLGEEASPPNASPVPAPLAAESARPPAPLPAATAETAEPPAHAAGGDPLGEARFETLLAEPESDVWPDIVPEESDEPAEEVLSEPIPEPVSILAPVALSPTVRKAALAALVGELEALRAVMATKL